jgi:hypothetical protein
MSCCSNCNTKLLERKYVFNEQDDKGNLFCPNNECEKYTNKVFFYNKEYDIRYCCLDCGRTLCKIKDKEIVKKGMVISNWYFNYNMDFDNFFPCEKCYNMMIKLLDIEECETCGNINLKGHECFCKTDYHDGYIQPNNHKIDFKYIKSKNNSKCNYCGYLLQKCNECEEACYVCIECNTSQINGNKLNYFSYLCENHAKSYVNCWTKEKNKKISDDNNKCDNCGMTEIIYPDIQCCSNMEKHDLSFCLNCCDEDRVMVGLFCYSCY